MAKKSEPKNKMDRIREVSPRYTDLLDKHAELSARLEELRAEVGGNTITYLNTFNKAGDRATFRVVESLGAEAARNHTWTSEMPPQKPAPVRRDVRGAALLGELLPAQPEHELNPPPLPPEWPRQQRYREISSEIEAIGAALHLIGPEIQKERRQYSKKVAELRGGDYTDRVERAVDAARALADALLEMHRFVNDVRLDGADRKYLRPVNLSAFGDLGEDYSPLRRLILDAIELKHVSGDKLMDSKMPAPLDYLT